MKIINIIWLIAGFICLILGMAGIVLPLLPTTPFFIATLFCFTRGSERIKKWFMKTSFHKKYLQRFYEEKGLTLKRKVIILSAASIMLALGFYFSAKLYARILISCVILAKYYVFIFKIKTIPEEDKV